MPQVLTSTCPVSTKLPSAHPAHRSADDGLGSAPAHSLKGFARDVIDGRRWLSRWTAPGVTAGE